MSNENYGDKSLDELHGLASERNIEGRSGMNKEQLVAALEAHDSGDTGQAASAGSPSPQRASGAKVEGANPPGRGDGGASEVSTRLHEEQEQGFSGFVPDKTPNEHYTVAGVTSGKPTPENEQGGGRGQATRR